MLMCVLQIIDEDAALVEIGPRFVLNLIKIFQGSFGGPTLYENPHYKSPNLVSIVSKLEGRSHILPGSNPGFATLPLFGPWARLLTNLSTTVQVGMCGERILL